MRRFRSFRSLKRRRGMTFTESIVSMVIVAMLATMLVALISLMRSNMKDTLSYANMRIYAISTFETIQMDLENGIEIDTQNYDDDGKESGVWSTVTIECMESVFDKPLYHVQISMIHKETHNHVKTQAILREGCISYAP